MHDIVVHNGIVSVNFLQCKRSFRKNNLPYRIIDIIEK